MNILIHIFGKHMHIILGINLGVELLGHQVCKFLALVDSALQTYKVVLLIATPTTRLWEFQVPQTLANTLYFPSFYFNYYGVCFMVSRCDFNLHFLIHNHNADEYIYLYLLVIWISSFVKCPHKSFVHLLDKSCFS